MINLFSNMTAVLLLAAGAFLAAGMAFVCLRRQGCAGNKAAASVGIFALLAVPLCTYGAHALYCLADVPNLYRIGENPLLLLVFKHLFPSAVPLVFVIARREHRDFNLHFLSTPENARRKSTLRLFGCRVMSRFRQATRYNFHSRS